MLISRAGSMQGLIFHGSKVRSWLAGQLEQSIMSFEVMLSLLVGSSSSIPDLSICP